MRGVVAGDHIATPGLADRFAILARLIEQRREEALLLGGRKHRIDAGDQRRPQRRRRAGAAIWGVAAEEDQVIERISGKGGDVRNDAAVDAALVDGRDLHRLPLRPVEEDADAAAAGSAARLRASTGRFEPDSFVDAGRLGGQHRAADAENERARARKIDVTLAVVDLIARSIVARREADGDAEGC